MANRKKITPPELSPEIVLFHILPRLPAKSLLRFRCVCKQWQSFLTSPLFADIHLHHETTAGREKVFFFHSTSLQSNFQTIDCEDGLIDMPRCYPFIDHDIFPGIVASSVNGLVCKRRLTDMVIWNPLTGEYKTLFRPVDIKCYSKDAIAFELYYSCSDDDYKILSITPHRDVYIYSLRSDSWRKLESTLDYNERIPDAAAAGDHNLLDEKLHFVRQLEGNMGYVIIRFDLKTEKFTKIAVPYDCAHAKLIGLVVVRGCLQLMILNVEFNETWIFETWQMNGDGNWTKIVSSRYSDDRNHNRGLRSTCTRSLYMMRNGNWLVMTGDCICKVDPQNNTEDRLCFSFIKTLLPYIETFVSPNQFIKGIPIDC